MCGHPEDVHIAAAGLHHEQAVQAAERHCAVRVKEVGGQHRRGPGVRELPPGRIGVSPGSRRDPQRLEDPADRGRAGPVAELEQLTLDPLIPPAVILGGEPLDESGDPGAGRRPSRPVRAGPLPGDQAAVPPEHGAGRDQPAQSRPSRQEPDQRGEDSAAGPVQPWPPVARRSTATSCRSTSSPAFSEADEPAGQDQPAADPDKDEIEQAKGHGRPSWPAGNLAHRCSSQAGQTSGTPQASGAAEQPR